MLESGIYVRDFGTRLEEINLEKSGSRLKWFVVENEKAYPQKNGPGILLDYSWIS